MKNKNHLGLIIVLGAAFGVAINQIGMGIAIGVAIGVAIGTELNQKSKKNNNETK